MNEMSIEDKARVLCLSRTKLFGQRVRGEAVMMSVDNGDQRVTQSSFRVYQQDSSVMLEVEFPSPPVNSIIVEAWILIDGRRALNLCEKPAPIEIGARATLRLIMDTSPHALLVVDWHVRATRLLYVLPIAVMGYSWVGCWLLGPLWSALFLILASAAVSVYSYVRTGRGLY